MASQWENLFKNEGIWNGQFTRLEPDGTVVSNTPSRLQLERLDGNRCRFQLTRYPEGQEPSHHQTEFANLARSSLFLNDGSFSKGSTQWSPISTFGTELALVQPNARLRLVQMFKAGGDLEYLVLIRETREGQPEVSRPELSVDPLIGTWQGEAITYFNDWTTSEPMATELTITQPQPNQLAQELRFGSQVRRSQAQIQGARLLFDQGETPYQLLMLPGGGSSLCPQTIQRQTAFICEVGWLIDPHTRLRLMRQYKADGAWEHQTWIKERKVA